MCTVLFSYGSFLMLTPVCNSFKCTVQYLVLCFLLLLEYVVVSCLYIWFLCLIYSSFYYLYVAVLCHVVCIQYSQAWYEAAVREEVAWVAVWSGKWILLWVLNLYALVSVMGQLGRFGTLKFVSYITGPWNHQIIMGFEAVWASRFSLNVSTPRG